MRKSPGCALLRCVMLPPMLVFLTERGRPMRRRQFILFAGGAVASPLAARAQQPAAPVIGFLHSAAPDAYVSQLSAFRQSLKEVGYIEGRNLVIEYRWAEDQTARLPMLPAELVQGQIWIFVAGGSRDSALASFFVTIARPTGFTL